MFKPKMLPKAKLFSSFSFLNLTTKRQINIVVIIQLSAPVV